MVELQKNQVKPTRIGELPNMKCPYCGSPDSKFKVIDSRPVEESNSIRRRRECPECQNRFTTYEFIEIAQPVVLKKKGTKEYFDKNKLLDGLMKACEKRNVDAEALASEIEAELLNSLRKEVTSTEIGEMAMEKLRDRDAVAYVRFASVYREFKDVETFMRELEELKGNEK